MEFDPVNAVNEAVARKTKQDKEDEARFQAEQRARYQVPTDLEVRSELGRRVTKTAYEMLESAVSIEAFNRLASGYAMQGDYEMAVKFIQDPETRKEYERVLTALHTHQDCSCPKKNGSVDTRFVKDRIVHDGTIKNLIACAICGHLRC